MQDLSNLFDGEEFARLGSYSKRSQASKPSAEEHCEHDILNIPRPHAIVPEPVSADPREPTRQHGILVVGRVGGRAGQLANALNLAFYGIFCRLENGLDCTRSGACTVLHDGDGTGLTVRRWGRVGAREDRLCGPALPLEKLQNSTDLVSGLGVVVDLALEALEDLGIDHSRGAGHGG